MSGTAASEKELVFLEWLTKHGAVLNKLRWPAVDQSTGSRGAIAVDNIENGDIMLEIPGKLMMTPVDAFSDPDVGSILLDNQHLLRGDLLITVYLMHERRKKESSFYFPYLNILPELNNLSEWSDDELMLLQDEKMLSRATSTRRMLKIMFVKSIVKLSELYPTLFPTEEFTFEAFVFSWYTIQARAFGRRLPWTALVPFADCLNHSNVQTKYDYNTDVSSGDKVFRLFPTGRNRYVSGCEAFNSYGRRPNDNLLLEYGFSMLYNEWDEIMLPLSLSHRFGLFDDKVSMTCDMRKLISNTYPIHLRDFPLEAMQFLRLCVCETSEELETFKANGWTIDEDHGSVSRTNEMRALQYFIDILQDYLSTVLSSCTTIEDDLVQLSSLSCTDDLSSDSESVRFFKENRLRPALNYRVTRKNILVETARRLTCLLDIIAGLPESSDDVEGDKLEIKRISIDSLPEGMKDNIKSVLLSQLCHDRTFHSRHESEFDISGEKKSKIGVIDDLYSSYFYPVLANFIIF